MYKSKLMKQLLKEQRQPLLRQIRVSRSLRKQAYDFVDDMCEVSEKERIDLHFSEDNLVEWLIMFGQRVLARIAG